MRERERMGKDAARWWVVLLLATASNRMALGDFFHHMEDAFADDVSNEGSERNFLFCRMGNLQKSALVKLDPVLCTHIISEEASAQKDYPAIQFLLSESMTGLLAKDQQEIFALVENLHNEGAKGLDITIEDEAQRSESLAILQDLGKLLSSNTNNKLLSLTFVNHVPDVSTVEQLMSVVDVFTFFVDSTNAENKARQEAEISKLPISKDKILYGIKLAHHRSKDQRCPDILQRTEEETYSPFKSHEVRDTIKSLKEEVLQVQQNKMAGIHLWSLAEDDPEGICGKGSYPILHYIQSIRLHQVDSKPFEEFADLDIVLSTGESKEMEFLQNLDVTLEEMKKLPCERVGFYRHPSDCTKFYHCSEHRMTKFNHSGPYAGFLYKCPNGLVYDEKQSSCIWPSWSDPCKGSGELLPVPDQKFTCVNPGFHVDPNNCRWFYYCSDLGDGQLEAFEFLCPSDLLGFDEKQLLCNWKWLVPMCSNYGKKPQSSTEIANPLTNRTSTNSEQNRKAKELDLQRTHLQRTTTKLPRRMSVSLPGNEFKNGTFSRPVNNSTGEKKQIVVTNNTPNEIQLKAQNISARDERVTNQQNVPERKYGTAVWRRPRINEKLNQRTRMTDSNRSREDQEIKDLNIGTQNKTENNRRTNQNDLGILNGFVPFSEDAEGKRFFKGKVRKISLRRNQNNGDDREISQDKRIGGQEQNPKIRAHTNDKEDSIIFNNNLNKVFSEDEENLTPEILSESPPYVNVRCSKLEDGEGKEKDLNTFGCTSEVSLTIHIPRGKDPGRYILKEDQISKTAHQESQKISYLENIDGLARTAYDADLEHKTNSSSSGNQSLVSLMQKFDGSDHKRLGDTKTTTEPNVASELTNKLDFERQESSLTKSPENYEIKEPHNTGDSISEHSKLKAEKLRDENEAKANKWQKVRPGESNDSAKSMPIHFYPQGVLLSIDLAHVNEIPPQILLEVDNMLRKYMDEGEIDVTLLERKLNVTTVSADKENGKMEPEGIMEVIKVIENILNTSRELNNTATDETFNKTMSTLEIEHENITTSTHNISPEYETITIPYLRSTSTENENVTISDRTDFSNQTSTTQSRPKPRNPLISDKIQDSESPDSISRNFNDPKPFGRRRLFRKFRYPSIQEQLQRQMQLQNLKAALKDSPSFQTSDSDIKRQPPLTYTYPLSRNRAVSRLPNTVIVTDNRHLNQRGTHLPEAEDNAVRTSALPYGYELKNAEIASGDFANNQNRDIHLMSHLPHYDSLSKWAILETAYGARSAESTSYSRSNSNTHDPRQQKETEIQVTRREEAYRLSSTNQALADNTGGHYNEKLPNLQYGDKAIVDLGHRRKLTRIAANFDQTESYYNTRENAKNLETDLINNHDESKARKISFLSNDPQDNIEGLNTRRNGPERSVNTRADERKLLKDNLRLAPGRRLDNTTRTRGKRKLRVFVRKLIDNDSSSREDIIPNNNDKNVTRERISKSVLRAVKDRILQKHSENGVDDIELQIRYQDHVWNIPFVNDKSKAALSPEVCTRAGLFQHPTDCYTFYECFWDKWLEKFTLHVFSCPVKLVYDTNVRGCGRPSTDSPCANHVK